MLILHSLPKTQPAPRPSLTAPTNTNLESGTWTQSIIWDSKTPFRDFTQVDLSYLEDGYEEEAPRPEIRPRKRFRNEAGQGVAKDKFNISNDHTYDVAKETKLVRQTFGALEVEHSYPALKLQLPFVSRILESSATLLTVFDSTKSASLNKNVVLFIVLLSISPSTRRLSFRKSRLRPSLKISRDVSWARVVILERACVGQEILP